MIKFTESKGELDWKEKGGYLEKDFLFDSFDQSFKFVEKVAKLAESESHHPIILLKFKRVNLKLKTNKLDKITDLDKNLAKKINKLV
jgi:4a-hydroxytetrahydrobiopterin dehydratase